MSFLSSLTAVSSAAPSVLTDIQELFGLFGNKQAASPVPALFSAAIAGVNQITANLTIVDLAAEAQYQAVLGSNPNILSNPTEVSLTVWQELVEAATVLTQVNTAQRTLAAYTLAVNNWNANNSGSLTPSAVPSVPVSLQQYQ